MEIRQCFSPSTFDFSVFFYLETISMKCSMNERAGYLGEVDGGDGGQRGQVRVVEAAGGVGGVLARDREHHAARHSRPVGRGEREPVVSA